MRASPAVRTVALARLTDTASLARLAKTHPDWVLRKEAVARVTDRTVLIQVASADADSDVRRGALLRLDQKGVAEVARSARSEAAREQAAGLITDPSILGELAPMERASVLGPGGLDSLRAPESESGADSSAPGDGLGRIRAALLGVVQDPAIVGRYGSLDLDLRMAFDERRYLKEDTDGSGSAEKGKVLVETLSLVVRDR